MARLKPLWLFLGEIAGRLRGARTLVVASDFDGTLTPIVPHPDVAALAPRARRTLESLVALPRTRVAVLSGRRLEDLRLQVDVKGVLLAGAAGLETQDEAGRRERHVAPGRELPAELGPALQAWCGRFPGAWVEDKGPSLAVHSRALPARVQGVFAAGVRRCVAAGAPRARLVAGRKVFEVLPEGTWDKSAALVAWLEGLARALPFSLGDDTVDEPVHEAVRRRGGVTVAVGRRSSRAEFGLPGPAQVVWFLEWLAREWRETTPPEYGP